MDRRRIIDISMVILLPMLMAYSLLGETFHEAAGTLMFMLFIVHHVMNRGWYRSLKRKKPAPADVLRLILNALLAVFMILQPVTGILMSKHLYTFIDAGGAVSAARQIHLVCAYWGFVLLCIHAGIHLIQPVGKLMKKRPAAGKILCTAAAAVSCYGVFAFVRRGLADYMFMRKTFAFFDFSEPRALFFLDHISVMILFMTIGCILMKTMMQSERRQNE